MGETRSDTKRDLSIRFGSIYGLEEAVAMMECLRDNAPTCDRRVREFEEAFARYSGTRYARAVTSGTAALLMAMVAIDVGEGDEVITTPLTGARIIFADVDPRTLNIDPGAIEDKITPRTKAVVPVHLYGQPCDMDPIMELAEKHGFYVVEDAAHAPGAEYRGRKAGSIGHVGCFSFHEQKNMSTLGEGGMVITNDEGLYERVSLYRSHCTRVYGGSLKYLPIDEGRLPMRGRFWWQDFDDVGYNVRMTEMQAAVGLVQLRKLDTLNERRRRNAAYLSDKLKDIPGITVPYIAPDVKHVFHLYAIQIDWDAFGMDKTEFMRRMRDDYGIKVGTHYIPINWSTAYKKRGHGEGECPIAEEAFWRIITLPIHPRLDRSDLDYMVEAIVNCRL